MFVPPICAGIEERHKRISLRVVRRLIRAFGCIAVRAREGAIGRVITAAMLACADVLDVEGEERRGPLRQSAVFTAVFRPISYDVAQFFVRCRAV
jgi:hypothetical protein